MINRYEIESEEQDREEYFSKKQENCDHEFVDIEENLLFDDDMIYSPAICFHCHKKAIKHYALTNIEEIHETHTQIPD